MKSDNKRKKLLFISSGATITGVPVFFINMVNWFKKNTDFEITILTALGGPLENEYQKLATTFRLDGSEEPTTFERIYFGRLILRITRKILGIKQETHEEKVISRLKLEKFDLIYINSVASLSIFEKVNPILKTKTILHVHELQMSILQFCGIDILKRSIQYCDHFIAISNAVKANLLAEFNIPEKLISLVYTFVDIKKSEKINLEEQHTIIRDQLSIPNDAFIVASAGTTDWRKGADLVVQIARIVKAKTNIQVHFIWMGGDSTGLEIQKLNYDVTRLNLESRVHFLGVKDNLLDFLAASDIFMLCSREEPVGIVALEAASLGKPVLCFEQAGGMPEFVQDNCGFVLPYLDIEEMANHIIMLQENRSLIRTLGENAAKKVQTNDINIACKKIESVINSVIEL